MPSGAEAIGSNESTVSIGTERPSVLGPALLSALLPGLGQFLLKKRHLGFILLCAEICLLGSFLVFRLPRFYYAWVFLIIAWVALHVAASWNALVGKVQSHRTAKKTWLLALIPFSVVAALFICARTTVLSGFRTYYVASSSMENTIYAGDQIMADMRAFHSKLPARNDVAILRKQQIVVVKRVIAVPGDTIEGRDNKVILNGQFLNEPFVQHTHPDSDAPIPAFNFVRIPKGEIFVMGDNRDVSLDSRSPEMGLVVVSQLLGKPIYIVSSKHDDARRDLR